MQTWRRRSSCVTRSAWSGAIQALSDSGKDTDERLLPHYSPLGWDHINLTGDYISLQHKQVEQGMLRPLRSIGGASLATSS